MQILLLILCKSNAHYRFNIQLQGLIFSLFNQVHTVTAYFLKMRFNIIFPCTSKEPFMNSAQIFVRISNFFHVCYMSLHKAYKLQIN
jgi:hypothetical protein